MMKGSLIFHMAGRNPQPNPVPMLKKNNRSGGPTVSSGSSFLQGKKPIL